MRITLFGLFVLLFSVPTFGQHHHHGSCATDEMHEQYMLTDRNYREGYVNGQEMAAEVFQQLESGDLAVPENTPYIIPVVVHVMYHAERDNISDEQIQNAIDLLNADFRRLNADANATRAQFQGVAADMNIEFRLARLDPDGNCTNGITRTRTPLSLAGNNSVKQLIAWDNRKYLNIWTVRTISISAGVQGTVLGYATFPNPNNGPTSDGIVIRHDRMGAMGTSSTMGRTLTHEVGHCLNLFHTFQGGCFGTGDGCGDTPPAAEANFGCAVGINSCSNNALPDQVENYMDYSNDNCMNMFTICQRQRATAVLLNNALRGSLVTPHNLAATGVEQTTVLCPPTADFTFTEKSICQGTSITFTNRSAIQDGDAYWWIFPGGTPNFSTDTNPTVTYNTPGTYPVYLDVNRNGQQLDRKGIEKAIAVRVNYPELSGVFSEGFENTEIPFPWHTVNEEGRWAFEVTSQAAYSGNRSATLNNFDIRTNGLSTSLISPQIDMRWTSNLVLRWKHAFARTSNANSDQLRIAVSTDCGETWQIRAVKSSFILASMPSPISSSWTPSQLSHWKEDFLDLSTFANSEDPIIIRFELVNGGGNNFFIDDIQLDATVSAETFAREDRFVSVFPNPNNGAFRVAFDLPEATAVTAILVDITGRQLAVQEPGVLPAGKSDVQFDVTQQLSSGMYLLKIQTAAFGEIIRKITVE